DALIARVDEAANRLRTAAPTVRPATAQASFLEAPAPPARSTTPKPSEPAPASQSPASAPVRVQETPPPAVDLGEGWTRATEEILKKKALLGSVVKHAVPLRLAGGVLTIGLAASPFHLALLA